MTKASTTAKDRERSPTEGDRRSCLLGRLRYECSCKDHAPRHSDRAAAFLAADGVSRLCFYADRSVDVLEEHLFAGMHKASFVDELTDRAGMGNKFAVADVYFFLV